MVLLIGRLKPCLCVHQDIDSFVSLLSAVTMAPSFLMALKQVPGTTGVRLWALTL